MSSKGIMNGRNHNTGTVGYLLNVNFMRLNELDFIYLCVPIVLKQCLIEIEYHVSLILRQSFIFISVGSFIKNMP